MNDMKPLLAVLLFFITSSHIQSTESSNILVCPSEYSHWMNIKVIANALSSKGHSVTVLRPNHFKIFMKGGNRFEYLDFETSKEDQLKFDCLTQYIHSYALPKKDVSFFRNQFEMHKMMASLVMKTRSNVCKDFWKRKDLFEKISQEKFDVVLSDALLPGGEIIAAKLGIPQVAVTNILFGDSHFLNAGATVPLSYIPMLYTKFGPEMTFLQRTWNVITFGITHSLFDMYYMPSLFQPIVDKHLGPHINWEDLIKNTSLWLVRTDFAFEFSRPYTPNMKFVGGLTAGPGKQLSKEYEDFLSSTGENGFVVFSLGSMVASMQMSKANMLASAFSKLKQKVLWRYSGERPETLGSNTKLVDWLPQNDLLAHPNCKLFITHGGNGGVYEAIYHGVPMLGLPLFGDQYDNLFRIEYRGGAIVLQTFNLKKNDFSAAIQKLIYNKSYKENMLELSKRHRDQPMSPLDSAVYWIEYVIRHKGAYHLRPANHKLHWFQYYLLDVIVFLLVICLAVLYLNVQILGLVWRKCKQIFKPAEKVKKN